MDMTVAVMAAGASVGGSPSGCASGRPPRARTGRSGMGGHSRHRTDPRSRPWTKPRTRRALASHMRSPLRSLRNFSERRTISCYGLGMTRHLVEHPAVAGTRGLSAQILLSRAGRTVTCCDIDVTGREAEFLGPDEPAPSGRQPFECPDCFGHHNVTGARRSILL